MNGRKSKALRKLAGVTAQNQENRSYHGVEHTVRNKTVTYPFITDANGAPVVTHRFRTATYALNQGARLLNKMLKRDYVNKLRNPTAAMLSA